MAMAARQRGGGRHGRSQCVTCRGCAHGYDRPLLLVRYTVTRFRPAPLPGEAGVIATRVPLLGAAAAAAAAGRGGRALPFGSGRCHTDAGADAGALRDRYKT